MKVKYIIPKGYKTVKGKRKPLKDYVEKDFEGLYYNGEAKQFARYYVFDETANFWFLDRHVIGEDVSEGCYSKLNPDLWPPLHITKVEKDKK